MRSQGVPAQVCRCADVLKEPWPEYIGKRLSQNRVVVFRRLDELGRRVSVVKDRERGRDENYDDAAGNGKMSQ